MHRRELLRLFAALGPAAVLPSVRAQDTWPSRPIRIICGSAPGALLDAATRLYAERMSRFLGQPVVVDNVAGASSMLAARTVARAEADGYTLLTAANTITAIPHMSRNAAYAMKDFTGVGEMARSPSIMVTSSASPFRSVADVVAAAKKSPGALNYASGGQGTTSHLPAELFAREAGITLTHVPYKGVAPAVPDVVAHRVAFMMATPTSVAGLVQNRQLRVLAITSDARSPRFPDVPTFKELGYAGATFEIWVGMLAPAALPPALRAKLGAAMEAARDDAHVAKKLDDLGQALSGLRTPEHFDAFMRAEEAKYAKLIREANIVAQ